MHSCIWQEKWTHNFFLKNWTKKGLFSGDSACSVASIKEYPEYIGHFLLEFFY